MKKIALIIPALIAAACVIGCGNNKTKLSFTNAADSDGAINDIIWANNDAVWTTTDGYATSAKTEEKDVNENAGTVQCNVLIPNSTGVDVYIAAVDFSEAGVTGDSLSLSDGASNSYTLKATSSGKLANIK